MSRSETVWIVDDDRSIRWVLEKALQQEGMTTQSFDSADGVLARLTRQQPDVIISDIRMPGASGLDLLARIRELYPRLPVIIMTAHSDLDSAVASYQGGAFEYLPKPFDVDEAVSLVKRAFQHAQEPVSYTHLITARLVRVWLDTWLIASPVTSASICRFSATRVAARSIMRLRITPIWLLSTDAYKRQLFRSPGSLAPTGHGAAACP